MIKFRKYKKLELDADLPIFQCSCHKSMNEHFDEIVNEDGYDVAKFVYYQIIKEMKKAELEIIMDIFEERFKKDEA